MGSRALGKKSCVLTLILYALNFVQMRPDNSVIQHLPSGLSASALIESDQAYAVYIHAAVPNKPKNIQDHLRDNLQITVALKIPRGRYQAEWIDTKTGQIAKTEKFKHAGNTRKFESPKFANDIALRVIRTSEWTAIYQAD